MTPKEWANRTVKDIRNTRKRRAEGAKQAENYSFENMKKVQKRCGYK
ncbi:transcriptional regulator [uncultured Clostridium sp.]|nr:transcriptional regulator [uncultured Clostridium sp.]